MIAPIAAKQGAQSKLKVKNEKPANALPFKTVLMASCAELAPSEPNTPTISSFATKPKIVATAHSQVPNPKGLNIVAIGEPINVKMEVPLFSSVIKCNPFSNETLFKSQIKTLAAKITVPARLINDHALSHVVRKMFETRGEEE